MYIQNTSYSSFLSDRGSIFAQQLLIRSYSQDLHLLFQYFLFQKTHKFKDIFNLQILYFFDIKLAA